MQNNKTEQKGTLHKTHEHPQRHNYNHLITVIVINVIIGVVFVKSK